jgi:hypothetical protein
MAMKLPLSQSITSGFYGANSPMRRFTSSTVAQAIGATRSAPSRKTPAT